MALASIGSNPVFPSYMPKPRVLVSTQINILTSQRKKIAKVYFSKMSLKIFYLLHSVGLVNNYVIGSTTSVTNKKPFIPSMIWFTLLFYKSKPFFRYLRLVSKPSKKYFISFQALKLLTKFLGLSLIILETSFGIIDHNEALRRRVGGVFLYILS